jgi:hypothetical protein
MTDALKAEALASLQQTEAQSTDFWNNHVDRVTGITTFDKF